MIHPTCIPLAQSLPLIRSGDIGLLRATSRFGRWIRRIGGCDLVHACMFGWSLEPGGTLWVCEQVKPAGQMVTASEYFDGLPAGTVTVFRPKGILGYDGDAAWQWMVRNVPGLAYPRRTILRSLAAKMPFIRWHVRASDDDEGNGLGELVCSGAVSRASRVAGGVDLVPRLSDGWTEPIHLFHSAALDQLFAIGG